MRRVTTILGMATLLLAACTAEEAPVAVGDSGDPRVLWPLSDLLRFTQGRAEGAAVLEVAEG